MRVLMQLNEIAIALTQPHCDDGVGTAHGAVTAKEEDLELASQTLNVALNHASGVIRGLVMRNNQLLSTARSTEEISSNPGTPAPSLPMNNHAREKRVNNQNKVNVDTRQQQLMQIVNLHETNSVCILWYNLSLVRSKQRLWAEAKTNLSIVASLASEVFSREHVLPLLHVVDEHLLLEARQRSSTMHMNQSSAKTLAVRLEQIGNRNGCAAAWQCMHSLVATTAILGTAFHPTVADLLQTLGKVYSSSGHEMIRHKQLALAFFDIELTVERALWSPSHPSIVATLSSMVAIHASLCNHSLAYEGLREIHQLQLLRGEPPQRIASTLWDMGVLKYSQHDDYPRALELFQRALQQLRSASYTDSASMADHRPLPQLFRREIAAALNSIGFVLHRMNRHQLALGFCMDALRMLRSIQPQRENNSNIESPSRSSPAKDSFRTLYHIAVLHSQLGHSLTALSFYEQAVGQTEVEANDGQQQQIERGELVKIFILMAKLSLDEESDPRQALQYCCRATDTLVSVTASFKCHDDAQWQERRRHWIQLAELRLSSGDVHGGMQTCMHLARHFCANSNRSPHTCCFYSYSTRFLSAYYVTKVASRAPSASAA